VLDNGNPIPDGTLMTVIPMAGRIATPDADPQSPGRQIQSSGGRYEFDWRAPTVDTPEAFAHGNLGEGKPESGISAVFKGIDFNDNKRVDVVDIGFIRYSEGDLNGTDTFDTRKDLNGDNQINSQDTQKVIDRWSLEFPNADHCAECTPTPKTYGVKIRPVPDRASIAPGGSLTIDIVAEGLDNLGGFEFGSILDGNSLVWKNTPVLNDSLNTQETVLHQLGPNPYDTGYRMGAWFSGVGPGSNGTAKLATLTVMANQTGETHLILSAPVVARMDGTEQAIMQTVEGIYFVGSPDVTRTPTTIITPTNTKTQTPTRTATPQVTPTPTKTLSTNYDIWPPANGDGMVDSRDLIEWIERVYGSNNKEEVIFDFARFWKRPAR
jgi:hypothetical protein